MCHTVVVLLDQRSVARLGYRYPRMNLSWRHTLGYPVVRMKSTDASFTHGQHVFIEIWLTKKQCYLMRPKMDYSHIHIRHNPFCYQPYHPYFTRLQWHFFPFPSLPATKEARHHGLTLITTACAGRLTPQASVAVQTNTLIRPLEKSCSTKVRSCLSIPAWCVLNPSGNRSRRGLFLDFITCK